MTDITVVSGLPRSGTSMMMAMLAAGGLALLVDGRRTADEDNPRGYYEYEKVKRLQKDATWLHEAEGRVVKVVATLLPFLPPQYRYRVVFMERDLDEILASQNAMLARSGGQAAASDEKMAAFFTGHLQKMKAWLAARSNVSVCYLNFNRLFQPHPEEEVARLGTFLDAGLDQRRMLAVIDDALYRKRKAV